MLYDTYIASTIRILQNYKIKYDDSQPETKLLELNEFKVLKCQVPKSRVFLK